MFWDIILKLTDIDINLQMTSKMIIFYIFKITNEIFTFLNQWYINDTILMVIEIDLDLQMTYKLLFSTFHQLQMKYLLCFSYICKYSVFNFLCNLPMYLLYINDVILKITEIDLDLQMTFKLMMLSVICSIKYMFS